MQQIHALLKTQKIRTTKTVNDPMRLYAPRLPFDC